MYHPQPNLMKDLRGTIAALEYLPGQVVKVWQPPAISKQQQEFSLKTPILGGRRSKTQRRRL
jgi:hypothetical protein